MAVAVVRVRGVDLGMLYEENAIKADHQCDGFRASRNSSRRGGRRAGTAAGTAVGCPAATAIGNKPQYARQATGRACSGTGGGKTRRTNHSAGGDDGRDESCESGDGAQPGFGGEESCVGRGKTIECHAARRCFQSAELCRKHTGGDAGRRLGAGEKPLEESGSAFRAACGEPLMEESGEVQFSAFRKDSNPPSCWRKCRLCAEESQTEKLYMIPTLRSFGDSRWIVTR